MTKIPYGHCHCGCGRRTTIARQSETRSGYVRGKPKRFCMGHGGKISRVNPPFGLLDGKKVAYIALTRGQVTIVDREDYKKLAQYSWTAHYIKVTNTYYAVTRLHGVTVPMQRMLFKLETGDPRLGEHRNGNSLDNRKSNLRYATRQNNTFNRRRNVNSTSGYKGVTWSKQNRKWQAQIQAGSRKRHLGYFSDIGDAHEAYKKAAILHHGEFARFA